jgi:hypothetical protein
MAKFRHKTTGRVVDVENSILIDVCLTNPEFEEITFDSAAYLAELRASIKAINRATAFTRDYKAGFRNAVNGVIERLENEVY